MRILLALAVSALALLFATGAVLTAPGRGPSCQVNRPLAPADPPLVGDDVLELQERLRALGFYQGALDGAYGPQTAAAVRRWHESRGLTPAEVADIYTWLSLSDPDDVTVHRPPPASPPEGEAKIVVDIEAKTLTLYFDGRPFRQWNVATGRWNSPSPAGDWKVVDKLTGLGGGFGTRWLKLNVPWDGYGIHGTNRPWSIGYDASEGCIRMRNADVEELYPLVPIGTPVRINGALERGDPPRVMYQGMHGREVVFLQDRLLRRGLGVGPRNGRFGPETAAAVEELEIFYGLPPDGHVGTDLQIILEMR